MRVVVFVLLLFVGLIPQALAEDGDLFLPVCLGPICFHDKWAAAEPFLERYGKGLFDEGAYPEYLYVTKGDNSVWVEIVRYHGENQPIATITFSEYALETDCQPPAPKTPFGIMVTEHGIGLQSTRAEVESVYGQPTFFQDLRIMGPSIPVELLESDDAEAVRVARYVPEDPMSGDPILLIVYLNDEVVAIELTWY